LTNRVTALGFSPSGQWLATGGDANSERMPHGTAPAWISRLGVGHGFCRENRGYRQNGSFVREENQFNLALSSQAVR